MTKKINIFGHLKADFSSGLVVFLVALPLCLGIAMASGAPLFSGIISGVIGGIVVGALSSSHISVSGPAAGLTAIVLTAITQLGAFEIFLLAVVLAGVLQLVLGFIRAGSISNYFPTNVIEGMLAGIGIIIFLKQIPKALGSTVEVGSGLAIFTDVFDSFREIQFGAIIITAISLFILIFWDKSPALKKIKLVPSALVAVVVGIIINEIFIASGSDLALSGDFLVSLPVPQSAEDFKAMITLPAFGEILNPNVWVVAITITIVASIETLLCIEAADRMDVYKRYTHTNQELKAQGVGNMLSGLLGGLPMTSVVVRSSANANAGARTKMSAIIHGVLLLISVLTIAMLLNKIPLATLAAILLLIGYKLAKPSMFTHFIAKGKYQYLPFIATVVAVVFLDLLKGVGLGILISIIFILKGNLKRAYLFRKEQYHDGDVIRIKLAQEVSFLNKAAIKYSLNDIPENSKVVIDASDTVYIAHDVLDLIEEFRDIRAMEENIEVTLVGFKDAYELENTGDEDNHITFEQKND